MGVDPQFLEFVVGSLSSGVLAVDGQGHVQFTNAAARRVLRLGHGDAMLEGAHCRCVLGDQPQLAELLMSALAGGEMPGRAELALRSYELGKPGPVIGLTITAVRDQAENVVGASVVFRDLDLVERLEEAARLRERLAALGEMAAGLAHEIRNPLAGLKVTTELLARRVGADAEAAELIREMSDEIDAVEGTVDAALAFVKPVPVALRSLDLVEVLEDAYTRVSARVPFAGTVQRFYETPAPHVTGDPDQLRSVFANLLENACESMSELRERGVLQLEVVTVPVERSEQVLCARSGEPQAAMRGGREVWVTVADSGPGIAPELRQKVFYPFFTTRESGSGVGLATAQKIVAAHGGALELVDAPIRGAAFRVRLAVGGAP